MGSTSTGGSSAHEIPDYELIRPIGRGGFGTVWMARSHTGVFRAVKIVPESEASELEQEGIRTFEVHARQHSNLITVRHVGTVDEAFYYVMDLADGYPTAPTFSPTEYVPRTLKSDLERKGAMDRDEILAVASDLAAGLQHLHDHGLLYRDVKPSNVVFVDGRACWADVGLVTSTQDRGAEAQTPSYAPPEGQVERRSDVYSMGLLLYVMATGLPPGRFPECPSGADPGQRETLRRLVPVLERATRARPEDRQPSIRALGHELHDALARPGRGVRWALGLAGLVVGLWIVSVWRPSGAADALAVETDLRLQVRPSPSAPFFDEVTETTLPLRAGELIRLRVELDRPGHPVVFAYTIDDGYRCLHPTGLPGTADRDPVRSLLVPRDDWLRLEEPDGTLVFLVLASAEPLSSSALAEIEASLSDVSPPPELPPDVMVRFADGTFDVRRSADGGTRSIRSDVPAVEGTPTVLEPLIARIEAGPQRFVGVCALAVPQASTDD